MRALVCLCVSLLCTGCFHAGAPVRTARVLDPGQSKISLQHTIVGFQSATLPENENAQRHPFVPEPLGFLLLPGYFANTQVQWATSPDFGEEVTVSLGLQEFGLEWRHALMGESRMLWRDEETGDVTMGLFDVATSAMVALRPLMDPTTPFVRVGLDVSKEQLFGEDVPFTLSLGGYLSWGPEAYLVEDRVEVSREARVHVPVGLTYMLEESNFDVGWTLGYTPFFVVAGTPERAQWGQHVTLTFNFLLDD